MKVYKDYSFLDIAAKAKEKISDYLFLPSWKMRLCMIGKNSKIKRGVKILDSGKRVTLGNNFKILHRCFLSVGNGRINFGDNGHIGVGVYIVYKYFKRNR